MVEKLIVKKKAQIARVKDLIATFAESALDPFDIADFERAIWKEIGEGYKLGMDVHAYMTKKTSEMDEFLKLEK